MVEKCSKKKLARLPKKLAHYEDVAKGYFYFMAELSMKDIKALVYKMQQVDYIETYLNFPEVITAGPYRLDDKELTYLLNEKLIKQTHRDTNGRLFCFTCKFKNLLG